MATPNDFTSIVSEIYQGMVENGYTGTEADLAVALSALSDDNGATTKWIDLGASSAYAIAVEHGYTGTEYEWIALLMDITQNAQIAKDSADSAAESAASARQSEEAIPAKKDEALQAIASAESGALQSVNTAGTTQTGNVNTAGQTQVQAVNAAGTTQIGLVQEEGSDQRDVIIAEGERQTQRVSNQGILEVQAVANEGTRQTGLVTNEGDDQVERVTAEGTTQAGLVTAEGTTQVGNVSDEGATQIAAVQDKGNEVLDSIPQDYQQVVADLSALKSQLKEYNAVNLLPHLSDRTISSSGVTGSVTDDVIVINGTTSAALNIRYYNRTGTLPEWWIPGRDVYVYIEKTGTGLNTTTLRIGKYNSDGSSEKITDIFESTVFHIPDDFDGVGLYIMFYIATGRTVNGSFYAYILNTLSNAELTKAVNATKRMSELKVACFGDSIMWGRDGNGSGSTQTPYTIPNAIAKRLDCVCDNYGVGGQGFIHSDGTPNAYDNISGVDLTAYTVMVMCYGVNDGFDTVGEWDSTDESTIMGQFNKILNYVYTQNPSIRLIVFAPWPGRNVGVFPDYWYGDVTVASTGRTSRKILSDAMKQACDYYWIPYVEQYDSPINPLNIRTALPDGVHPSNDFYKLIGDWVAAKISVLL